jgi:hypothetical protein
MSLMYVESGQGQGITGEIAESEAVRLLGLKLAPVRTPGCDVIRRKGARIERLQVKGCVVLSERL